MSVEHHFDYTVTIPEGEKEVWIPYKGDYDQQYDKMFVDLCKKKPKINTTIQSPNFQYFFFDNIDILFAKH